MIISHKHKYIFIKTSKTAGTSTEIFFQNLSFSHEAQHSQPELMNEEGIVGFRGTKKEKQDQQPTFCNHSYLSGIKRFLNNDKIFNEYFKFSITRNPWDRVVSRYHFFSPETSFKHYIIFVNRGHKSLPPIFNYFNEHIDDVHFIRFENLNEDVEYICKKLGLNYDMNNFGTYKSEFRKHSKHKHYTEYYDDETRQIVAEKYAKDIEYFGYKFGE